MCQKVILSVMTGLLAVAISTGFATGTVSAQTISVTQTSTDALGNKKSFTKSHNANGSESISKSFTDASGNKKSFTKSHNADGSESFSKSITDASGNKKSFTKRENTDGSESITITKTNRARVLY